MPVLRIDQQNRAQICYRKGDYAGALKGFTAILEKWADKKNPPMSVLDNRAATLIKLKRYDEAMKDARTMIKADNTLSSGFLRAGQILRNQGKDKKAVEIYELGLKSVVDSAALKLLRDEMAAVKKLITPDKAKDWLMTTVPIEVLELIIEMLQFRDMVKLVGVCQLWKRLLTGTPRLWRELDFGLDSRIKVKHKTIQVYAERAHWGVTRLKIAGIAPGTLRMLLNKCKLKTLQLGGGRSTQEQLSCLPSIMDARSLRNVFMPGCTFKFDKAFSLIHALPNITSLNIRIDSAPDDLLKLPSARIPATMERLTLHGEMGSRAFHLGDLLTDAINLQHISISEILDGEIDLRHMDGLKSIDLRLITSTGPVLLPPSIEQIQLEYDYAVVVPPGMHEDIQDESLPLLRTLRVTHRHSMSRVEELLHQCGRKLEEFVFMNAWDEPADYFMERVRKRHFLELETLFLDDTCFGDDELAAIGQNCPSLDNMAILDANAITGSGIRQIVEAAPQLQSLYIRNCKGISMDAINWARNRGVRVRFEHGT